MAMKTEKAAELLPILEANPSLPWEAMPTWTKKSVEVQRALIPTMGLTALIRQLGRLTELDAISPLSTSEGVVVERISDEVALRKSRVHPMQILTAMRIYASGHGLLGSGRWSPSQRIVDALDRAFYKAFQNVTPSGKRFLLALDVSGSMGVPIAGMSMTCREVVAAMALVTAATEPQHHIVAFTGSNSVMRGGTSITPLAISPRMRLDDVVKLTANLPFGGTDCALPMLYAMARKLPVDAFVIYTDNETWAGTPHPMEALRQYRKASGINAKLIVVGITSTGFSIADPNDAGALDVVGFDTAVPQVISSFVGR
jgi:60 kDa SS-A/Ro ribonucleoprotein